MTKQEKDEIYDELSNVITEFQEVEAGYPVYEMLVKIQNNWDELTNTPNIPDICWRKYKDGEKKYLSVLEENTLPSKKYGGYYIGFPEGDTKDQEEWYIKIPDLLKLPRKE